MEALDKALVARLDFASAIQGEIETRNESLPAIAGLETLASNIRPYTRYLRAQLQSGLPVTRAPVVDAKKSAHSARPLTVLALDDQVTYRSLVDLILADVELRPRTPEAYATFIQEPIHYALRERPKSQGSFNVLFDTEVTHVVISDISAFYQYVDHALLKNELVRRSAEFEAIEALMALLCEVQGRDFGLPQLYLASDLLSEVYIDILERRLLRQGLAVWRFSDDFRIACSGYLDTLRVLDELHEGARDIGLVVNETKTLTPTLPSYFITEYDVQPGEDAEEAWRTRGAEEVVGDYADSSPMETSDALDLLSTLNQPTEGRRQDLTVRQLRRVNRALRSLTATQTVGAEANAASAVAFQPSLTSIAIEYLVSVSDQADSQVATVTDNAIERGYFSAWQSIWIAYLLREGALLDSEEGDSALRRRWAATAFESDKSDAVKAHAALTLARHGLVTSTLLAERYEFADPAWKAYYLLAIKELQDGDPSSIDDKLKSALERESPLARWILNEQSAQPPA